MIFFSVMILGAFLTSISLTTKPLQMKKIQFILPVFIFLLLVLSQTLKAQGNLMLFQKRVVFEGSKRIATVDYANTGQDTARYVVSLIHNKMNENGLFERLPDTVTSEWFADKYVRIFPRNIVLGPNEAQTMKIQLINTQGMKPGEYRSHMFFRSVPDKEQQKKNKNTDSTDNNISISLKPVFGFTIPVIIRLGKDSTVTNLTNIKIEKTNDTAYSVSYDIIRQGNFSVFGNITVIYISAAKTETEVGCIKGLAVYTPGNTRHCSISLKNSELIDYKKGKLRLIYSKPTDEKGTKLAEEELELGE